MKLHHIISMFLSCLILSGRAQDLSVLQAQLLAQNRQNYNSAMEIGFEAFKTRDYGKAKSHFEQAILYIPINSAPYYYLGTIYYIEEDYKQTQKNFYNAIKYGDEGEDVFEILLFIEYKINNDYKAALRIAKKARRLFDNPRYKEDVIELAQLIDSKKNKNKIDSKPFDGKEVTAQNKVSKESISKIDSIMWGKSINMGVRYYNKKKYTKSIQYFSEAKTHYPDDTIAYLFIGKAEFNIKHYNSSLENLYLFLDKGGKSPDAYYRIISIEKILGNFIGAKKIAQKAYDIFKSPRFATELNILENLVANTIAQNKAEVEEDIEEKDIEENEEITNPRLYPFLIVKNFEFNDKNKNNGIDVEERVEFSFDLVNEGEGAALDLKLIFKETNNVPGLNPKGETELGTLNANTTRRITFTILSTTDIRDDTAKFEFIVMEQNGFDSETFEVEVPTIATYPPYLEIVDHFFTSDKGGKIQLGIPIKLQFVIQNLGKGSAEDLELSINLPENVFSISEDKFSIGILSPGESKIVNFEFIANRRYAKDSILLGIEINEKIKNLKKSLIINLEDNLKQTSQVVLSVNNVNSDSNFQKVTLQRPTYTPIERPLNPEDFLKLELINKLKERKYFALLIGIDIYDDPNINPLINPVNDTKLLAKTLIENYTFDEGNVIRLENPTRGEIIEKFDYLANNIQETDNLLIFYAGHGQWEEKFDQGYWLPSDAQRDSKIAWFSNSTIVTYIRGINSKHTLLISDACFSGGIFRTRKAFSTPSKAILGLYKLPSRKAMTSGAMTTVPDKSVFIEYLLKRLTQNTEMLISAQELFSSFRSAVINNSFNGQVPQYGDINNAGDEGGEFIFLKR